MTTPFADYAVALSEALLAEVKRQGGGAKFVRRTLPSRVMIAGMRFELPDGRAFVFSSLPDGIRIWPGAGYDDPELKPLKTIPAGEDRPEIGETVKQICGLI
jgi:hypothetical protein